MSTEHPPTSGQPTPPVPQPSSDAQPRQAFIELNTLTKTLIGLMAGGALVFITFFLGWFLPLRDEVRDVKNDVGHIKEDVKEIKGSIGQFNAAINEKTVPSLVRGLTSAPTDKLEANLPATQTIINIAKQNKVPASPQQIRDMAEPLLTNKSDNPALKKKVWNTVSQIASFKTVVNQQIPASLIETAKAQNKYFNCGGDAIELNDGDYTNAVFENCRIVYKYGSLKLRNVGFINCTFDIDQELGEEVLAELLKVDEPIISIALNLPPSTQNRNGS